MEALETTVVSTNVTNVTNVTINNHSHDTTDSLLIYNRQDDEPNTIIFSDENNNEDEIHYEYYLPEDQDDDSVRPDPNIDDFHNFDDDDDENDSNGNAWTSPRNTRQMLDSHLTSVDLKSEKSENDEQSTGEHEPKIIRTIDVPPKPLFQNSKSLPVSNIDNNNYSSSYSNSKKQENKTKSATMTSEFTSIHRSSIHKKNGHLADLSKISLKQQIAEKMTVKMIMNEKIQRTKLQINELKHELESLDTYIENITSVHQFDKNFQTKKSSILKTKLKSLKTRAATKAKQIRNSLTLKVPEIKEKHRLAIDGSTKSFDYTKSIDTNNETPSNTNTYENTISNDQKFFGNRDTYSHSFQNHSNKNINQNQQNIDL